MFSGDATEGVKDLLLGVGGQFVVGPDVVKPFSQFSVDLRVVAGEVDLDVGPAAGAKPALGKVRAADNAADRRRSEVELAMQEICLGDGTDANGVAAYPFGAALGKEFLLQRIVGNETLFGYVERLWLRAARVDVFY